MKHFSLPLAALIFDLAMKNWVRSKTYVGKFGVLQLELHWNEGVFAGFFSNSAALINQVFLSSVSVLLILFLAIILFVYRKDPVPLFHWSLIGLITGFTSNIVDRAIYGRVIDWIHVDWSWLEHFAFNFGDVLILFGMIGAMIQLFVFPRAIWFDSAARNRVLVEKKFQLRFARTMVGVLIAIFVGCVMMSLELFHLWVQASATGIEPPKRAFGWAFVAFFALIAPGVVYFGLWISRKFVGPIHAFEAFLDRLDRGQLTERDRTFKLRKDDSFKRLEKLAQMILERFNPPK